MLVGRTAELDRLRGLIGAVRDGGGGALVLRGDAGMGKTALLEAACADAGGLTVLEARGLEGESSIPFAALRDLIAPLDALVTQLPDPQRRALEGAVAAGPPEPGDRLAVLAATDGLLQAGARAAPVLALIDDAPWIDAPSLECLSFAARRARGGVGIVFAARDDLGPGLEHLEVAPLDPAAAGDLVDRAAPGLAAEARAAVLDLAGGNPLALRHLPATLAAQPEGAEAPPDPGRPLDRLFAGRIAALPAAARTALTVAATCGDGDLRAIVLACRALGADELSAAEEAGLVSLGAKLVTFVHPLARGAAYHAATPDERRAAHAALAETTRGAARAWHLAGAVVGPDEAAADALEEVAVLAGAQRAFASAAAAFERSARLSAPSGEFARRMLAAAGAALAAGRPEQLSTLLDEVEAQAADPAALAQAAYLRGLLRLGAGDITGGVASLEASADQCAAVAPPLAAVMLADAAAGCTAIGDCRRALAVSGRAAELLGADGDEATRVKVLSIYAWSLCLRGELPCARPVLAEVDRLAERVELFSPAAPALLLALNANLPMERFERTLERSQALAERARSAGALFVQPALLVVAADAAYRLGRWELVEALCAEAIELCEQTGQRGGADGHALVTRARLYAAQGRSEACAADVDAALALAHATGQRSGEVFARAARGFLALGTGDIEAAIAELVLVEALCDELGFEEPALIPWVPDLVEAYARAGHRDDAARVLARLRAQAERSETRWAAAAAARGAGLVSDVAMFGRALELHDGLPLPFERARTLFAQGSALQRAGRRAEARAPLREALDTFDALGAAPWAEQARAVLRAAGGRRPGDHQDALTPQELRVALAASSGASTKDIAAQLFLSPRTIESHLAHVYRKLGIRSRAALAGALASERREDGGEVVRELGAQLDSLA